MESVSHYQKKYNATWQLTDAQDGLYTPLVRPAGDVTTLNLTKMLLVAGVLLKRTSVSRDDHSVLR